MATYADYTFYTSTYGGSMTAALFAFYAPKASMHIDNITNGAAATAPVSMATPLKYACCAYVDWCKQKEDATKATKAGVVTSESNDGFSQSYQSGVEFTAALDAQDSAICREYLTFPFNLAYGGR